MLNPLKLKTVIILRFPILSGDHGAQSGVGLGTHGVMNKQMVVHWCHHPLPPSPTEPEVSVHLPRLTLQERDLAPAAGLELSKRKV